MKKEPIENAKKILFYTNFLGIFCKIKDTKKFQLIVKKYLKTNENAEIKKIIHDTISIKYYRTADTLLNACEIVWQKIKD